MAEGEWEHDGTEIEEVGSDDDGGNATITEGEDDSDEGEGGTQIAPQDTEMEEEVLRMMDAEAADDPGAGPRGGPAAPSGRNGGGGSRAAETADEDEQTPPTQIDSPDADSQAAKDRLLTPADPSGQGRAASPLRRKGQGSGVSLSGSVVTAGNGGSSSGFLSSAAPSAKASRARAATSLSSPQRVPQGWLDDQLDDAAAAAPTEGASATPPRDRVRRQNTTKGNGSGAAMNTSAAPVARALPRKPSPAKPVAVSGGWIRTKGSPSKGRHARTAVAEDEHAGAPDTQEGSVAQSILAIGVPHERRVAPSPRPRSRDAIAGAAARAAAAEDDGDQEEREDEETEMSAVGVVQGTVNSQELRPNEFSQIRKGCSQQDHDFERMMDAEIAAAAASGQDFEHEGEGGGDETDELPSLPRPSRYDGGHVVPSKRKKMRTSAHALAAGRGGGGSARASRGSGSGKGAIGSRTPGAYMRRPSSKSSTKRRTHAPRRPDSVVERESTVFDIGSEDDSSDADGGNQEVAGLTKPRGGRERPPDGASASHGVGKGKGKGKGKGRDPAGISSAARATAVDSGEGEMGSEEDCAVIDALDLHGDDVDEDVDQGSQVVRTEQDLQMERAMAAIRKNNLTPVSAPEGDDDEGEKGEEDEEEEEEEEEEESVVEEEKGGDGGVEETAEGDSGGEEDMEIDNDDVEDESEAEKAESGEEEEEEEEENEWQEEVEKGVDQEKVAINEEREGESRKEKCGGCDKAADSPSQAAETAENPRAGANGNQSSRESNACPSELTYRDLSDFLEDDGWKCVDGKGLHTWFYLLPGSKGRAGTYGVDYLVSEAEVAQYVRGDKQTFARYQAHRRETAARTAAEGRGSNGGDAGAGRRRGASDSSHAPPGRSMPKSTGATVAGSGAEKEPGARSRAGQTSRPAPPQQQNVGSNSRQGVGPAAGPPQAEEPDAKERSSRGSAGADQDTAAEAGALASTGKGPRSAPGRRRAGCDKAQGSDRAGGRRQAVARKDAREELYSEDKWREVWPKLREKGWHWVYGLEGSIYLKEGVTKKTGTVGVDMFRSKSSLLDFVARSSPEAATPPPEDTSPRENMTSHDNKEPPAGNGGSEPQRLQEWNMLKHRAPRRKVQRTFPGDTPPPLTPPLEVDVMSLPGRGAGRSAGSSTGARKRVDGQSAGGGSGGPVAPRALEGTRRGQGRPPKRSRGEAASKTAAKRGRVGGVKQLSTGGDGRGDGRGGGEQTRVVEDGEGSDDSREDMETAATQPQIELASAMNMAAAGSRRPDAVRPTAGAAAAVLGSASGTGDRGGAAGGSVSLSRSRGTAGENVSRAQGSTSAPAQDSPTTASGVGGDSRGGDCGGGAVDQTPRRTTSSSSPPNASSSAQNGGGSRRKKRHGSPTTGNNGVRSSSRRINAGPFSDLAVIVTGLRGDPRKELVATIAKLGGEEVVVFGKDSCGDAWKKWLLNHSRQRLAADGNREAEANVFSRTSDSGGEAAATPRGRSSIPPRRLIAVATPDSDRTPKFQLAMAAGVPIVHPSYVAACASIATEVKTDGYLLPLGRSALGDRGLVMPSRSGRDRPFQGKTIMLCMDGADDDRTSLGNWVLTLTVAGATVKLLHDSGSERKGAAGGGAGLAEASWCAVETAINLIEEGHVFCVIGPKITNGRQVQAATAAVEGAAERMGTPAGSLEWAVQCIAHGRLLLPNARTCPWFPLDAAGAQRADSSARPGSGDKNARGRGGGRRGSGRGGGRSGGRKGPAKRGASSGERAGSFCFHVHTSGGKRYVAGDYVFLEKGKGGATKGGGRGDTAAAAAVTAAAGVAGGHVRVARVVSFRREADGKVRVVVIAIRRGNGDKVLIAPGAEEGEGEVEVEEVDEEILGARVLALTKQEMEATQLYSLNDGSIFCLAD